MSRVRTNIVIEATDVDAIMDRYGVHTKAAAGPGNRRRAVGPNRLLAVAQIALPLVLLLTALFASDLPARRASPVNPAVALRAD